MNKKWEVYFNEFNILMENAAYLPLVSGLLRAYAETFESITDNYQFMPFLFHRDSLDTIVSQYHDPKVAAFSVSMWNEQLNLKVAEQVKKNHPECLVVFGGPSVPHHPELYFEEFPFIDIAVRGEGEEAFAECLLRLQQSRDFSDIPGIAWRDPSSGLCVRNDEDRSQSRDLDIYPSPYLEGYFDDLLASATEFQFQQIIETNRGCPFLCTFCFWGQGGLSLKYRFHSLERVAAEIDWAGEHQIRYMFNADSNFGMHRRDAEIAKMLTETKQKYGYPEKFRTCFGKNSDDKIFQVASLLHAHDLEKGITLARQSNDEQVLHNIKRSNIKMSTYRSLQTRFNDADVPVYCEFIIGLPGETYETWVSGISEVLNSGLKNQLFVYLCQVYPNTELADPEYQKKFGIVTRTIKLAEIHGAIRPPGQITEYEDVVTTTDSMSLEQWRKIVEFSWMTMLLHSMKLGFFVMYYLHDYLGVEFTDLIQYLCGRRMPEGAGGMLRQELSEFDSQIDRLLEGRGRGCELPEFGDIYWDEEEASFLRISGDLDRFYQEFLVLLRCFLDEQNISYDDAQLVEAVVYQRMRIPSWQGSSVQEYKFNFNFPEYFESSFTATPKQLLAKPQIQTLRNPRDFQDNRTRFARETILWGRKSDSMLNEVAWVELAPQIPQAPQAHGSS